MPSGNRSPVEKQAQQTSQQLNERGNANQDTAQGTLSQFEGPVQDSPFYKSLLTSGTEATSDAYDNATANMRAKANQSGFNYTQPAEQGAEAEIGGREAKAIGDLPSEAAQQASQAALTAAGDTAQIGANQQQVGEGYTTGAVVPLENQYQNAQNSFWKTLSSIPGTVTTAAAGAGGL